MKPLLTAAALLLALPLLAQQAPLPDQPFAESIDVSVANVEVSVTDRGGRHVQGLARGDFDLFVDGRKVEIVNFSEVAESSPESRAKETVTAAPAAPEAAGEAVAPAPEPPPVTLVVFVDNDNLQPSGRSRILRQIKEFLDSAVRPRDRVMLVTHEQGVTVRRPLNATTKESLADDLKKIEKLSARGAVRNSHFRRTVETLQAIGCEGAMPVARAYSEEILNDAKMTLRALETVVESLAGIEGRKVMFYVSDGVPMHPGEDMFRIVQELCGGSSVFEAPDLASSFRHLTRLANANGVTINSLETAGLRVYSGASAEENPLPIDPLTQVHLDSEKAADTQQVLFNLASETGGRAALNGNDLRSDLAGIAGDLRSYYSLGYTPERSGDGRVHAIEVKVKREGLRARSRTTYTDRPREELLAARVQTALLHGIVDNPLQAGLALVSSEPAGSGVHLVTLRVQLPVKQLVLVAQGNAWTGQLTLWVGARDAAGGNAPVRSVRVPIRIPAAQGKEQLARIFAYDLRMRMAERSEQTVAVGIQDDLGHTTSFITGTFRVDSKGAAVVSTSSGK
jgi:VWFA-related protein